MLSCAVMRAGLGCAEADGEQFFETKVCVRGGGAGGGGDRLWQGAMATVVAALHEDVGPYAPVLNTPNQNVCCAVL